MMIDHDPEVPAGFQDADLEQAELEARAREVATLRRRGICSHGWVHGLASSGEWLGEGPAPAPGHVLCLECGEHVLDPFG